MRFTLEDFVAESNRIEGILRPPSHAEMLATEIFLKAHRVTIGVLKNLQAVYAPGRPLRVELGMNVQVGAHRPPPGGALILGRTLELLDAIHVKDLTPFQAHQKYESLHPFMDGNGRTGRALWLKHMGGIDKAPLGFLHHWYYQSLAEHRA